MARIHEPPSETLRLYDPYVGLYTDRELRRISAFLQAELGRWGRELPRSVGPRPYFLSYLLRNRRSERISGRVGAVYEHEARTDNTVYCDVRVGSRRSDNVSGGGLYDNSDKDESVGYMEMPAEVSRDAWQHALWRLTDARYREAAAQFFDRRSRALHFLDPAQGLAARVKQPPARAWQSGRFPELDRAHLRQLVRSAGALIRRRPRIQYSAIDVKARHLQRLFCSSDGGEVLQQQSSFYLGLLLWLLTPAGDIVTQEVNLVETEAAALPDEGEFLRLLRERIALVEQLGDAPCLDAYAGPVLLSPSAAGLFFHEVLGHRLEGSRLLGPDEGGTFRQLRGRRIAPAYIDVVDDPGLVAHGGRRLIGHYRYDDEGSPAARVVLVERGVLRSFLTTSARIPGQRTTNGHARAERHQRPISRMGNLLVLNREPVPDGELWDRFLHEIRRQRRPYGVHVREVSGGESVTSAYDFQGFKGEIVRADRVYPDGRSEPVRGVDFVGTPLSALQSIVCMGATVAVDNGFCGAESGVVPVSTVCPAMLLRSLELQSDPRKRVTQYLIPQPGRGARRA